MKTSSRNASIDRRGASSALENPYNIESFKSDFKDRKKSQPISIETSERTEKFNIKSALEKRNERIKKYTIDYGIEIVDMKEFDQVRNIRAIKEQQKLKELRQIKELKSALVRKHESPITLKLRSQKYIRNQSTSPSEQVKLMVSEEKKKKKRKKKRVPSADHGSFLPPIWIIL